MRLRLAFSILLAASLTSLAGCGGGAAPVEMADMAVACAAPKKICDGTCVDNMTNPSHCGGCGVRCKFGDVCQNGRCMLFCQNGLAACGDPPVCIDLSRDAQHCGDCMTACPQGFTCSKGKCGLACQQGLTDCDGTCSNLQTDPAHCGDCGTACKMGFLCSAGSCALSCQQGLTRCDLMGGPLCVNLQTDNAHCGDCMTACALGTACTKGQCVAAGCPQGLTDCGGFCANLQADSTNCGACGTACTLGQTCQKGACVASCQMPLVACGKACIDPRFDPSNCGGCGMLCSYANALPACANGTCLLARCNVGWSDCDMQSANGCETQVASDPMNCLRCGNACTPAHGKGGCAAMMGCTVASCDAGWADCDTTYANGCEIDTTGDLNNCGGCGKACAAVANGSPACAMGACAVASCKAGYADCDKTYANGCEVNTTSDAKNCSACGMACAAVANGAAACKNGVCSVGACNAGFTDCNGQLADGCECNTGGSFACLGGACLPISCNALKKSQPMKPDGVYTIAPDRMTQVTAYCDMTTAGGGWTLLMKLAGRDFCYSSPNWTAQSPFGDPTVLLNTNFLAVSAPDAKSSAYYLMPDVTALRFVTTRNNVTLTFAAAATAMTLMTTNNVPFAAYPDYTAWKAAFLQDRSAAPIFVRAGVPVTAGNVCRMNPNVTPVGCGQPCMFCFLACDGSCCPCNAAANDVTSGLGLIAGSCNGATNCSAAGANSDPSQRVVIWGR